MSTEKGPFERRCHLPTINLKGIYQFSGGVSSSIEVQGESGGIHRQLLATSDSGDMLHFIQAVQLANNRLLHQETPRKPKKTTSWNHTNYFVHGRCCLSFFHPFSKNFEILGHSMVMDGWQYGWPDPNWFGALFSSKLPLTFQNTTG